ncbi:MAG TPA: hypothetical protein VGJ48_27510 [Pyrinomonadaceae bacterium]|jgi:dihydroxy-acid dehydratase
MSDNTRSRKITEGIERTPNRAMLRAVGFGDDDFDKPIIGVANAYSTLTPCNAGLNNLAKHAVNALREADTLPLANQSGCQDRHLRVHRSLV